MPADDAILWNGARPTPLDRAAQAFAEICARTDTPTVSGRAIGHGLPPRAMSARELIEVLPSFEAETRDAVWRELIRLAREVGEPWPTIAIGIALPGLRTAAGRLVRDYDGDTEDLDAELIAGFYEAIANATIDGPMICAQLRAAVGVKSTETWVVWWLDCLFLLVVVLVGARGMAVDRVDPSDGRDLGK
jgi:hypothetical protein